MRSISASRAMQLIGAFVLAGCSSTTAPSNSESIAKTAGDGQSAITGAPVATQPSVKVTENGAPLSGAIVNFVVASGGGTANGASVTTDASGVATAISWTLGNSAGTNTLTASLAGATGTSVTFSATALAPGAMTKEAGDGQTAQVQATLPVSPAVTLVDGSGKAVVGAAVTFFVASGGSILGSDGYATTDANGIATVSFWKLGSAPGPTTVTVFTAGTGITGNPLTFTATGTP